MKEKIWTGWFFAGLGFNIAIFCTSNVVWKVIFFVLECVCYGIHLYKLLHR